jgi:hypothetical protein
MMIDDRLKFVVKMVAKKQVQKGAVTTATLGATTPKKIDLATIVGFQLDFNLL